MHDKLSKCISYLFKSKTHAICIVSGLAPPRDELDQIEAPQEENWITIYYEKDRRGC